MLYVVRLLAAFRLDHKLIIYLNVCYFRLLIWLACFHKINAKTRPKKDWKWPSGGKLLTRMIWALYLTGFQLSSVRTLTDRGRIIIQVRLLASNFIVIDFVCCSVTTCIKQRLLGEKRLLWLHIRISKQEQCLHFVLEPTAGRVANKSRPGCKRSRWRHQ